MGLDYFSNSAPNNSSIFIPNRTINYGKTKYNFDEPNKKYLIRNNLRKKSCESNISNISSIFQKTLNSHIKKTDEKNHYNNSTMSTATSATISSNTEETKQKSNLSLSPIKNQKDISFDLRKSYYHRLVNKNIENMSKTSILQKIIHFFMNLKQKKNL